MDFGLIPAGEFVMGSPLSEANRRDDEEQHEVEISSPFCLGVCPVTQKEWCDVMNTQPWMENGLPKEFTKIGDDYPATYITWLAANEFCEKLSATQQEQYRLPTEAEWEYACRAGSTAAYHSGDDTVRLTEFAWTAENAGNQNEMHPLQVAQKRPNDFGLYDMHGNVCELCSDWYGEKYYVESSPRNPTGPTEGDFRVLRGGSFFFDAADVRSAFRFGMYSPDFASFVSGFRLVKTSL